MTASTVQFSIRDAITAIVDEYARKKQAAGQLGLFEKPEERQKPLFSKRIDDEEGRWVTMRGARVFISSDDGRIMKGPKALVGKTKEQIEKESAEEEGPAPKPKPLNELGRISGGRADNRQGKLFEELNPGFKFEDDEDEDFKIVEPVAEVEVPSSPADIFIDDSEGDQEDSFEESFELDSTPAPSPAMSEDFGSPDPATVQGALFDIGKNDLPGQELLFNSDAGDLNNPKTMENRASVPSKSTSKKMEDFGEHIPGARKEGAKKLGPRAKKEETEADKKPGWMKRYEVSQIVKSSSKNEEGKWSISDLKKLDWYGSPRTFGKFFDTKEEAEKSIPLAEVARNHRTTKLPDGTFAIYRSVAKGKYPIVKGGFESDEAAMKYIAQNPVEIIEHKFPRYEEYQYLDEVKRSGPDVRDGKSVSPKDFQKDFSIRGGQFGNWNAGKDGQTSLNHAFEAFHDLADILDLDPSAMTLNGDLAMAFGARGTGGKDSARAHYEPDEKIINLTKMRGAGTLSHEWAHALDHLIAGGKKDGLSTAVGVKASHLGKTARKEVTDAVQELKNVMFTRENAAIPDEKKAQKQTDHQREYLANHFTNIEKEWTSTYGRKKKPLSAEELSRWNELKEKALNGDVEDQKYKFNADPDTPANARGAMAGKWTNDVLDEMNTLHKKVTGRSFHTNQDHSAGKTILAGMQRLKDAKTRLAEAQEMTVKTTRGRSNYVNEAMEMDKTQVKDYYTMPEELLARAFEGYVEDKLSEQGRRSDYLIGKGRTDNKHYALYNMKPFPEGDERIAINAAFDKLFETLRGNELNAAAGKKEDPEKYSRTSYNVAARETMNLIVDRYCQDEPVMVDYYTHPLIHAAVGAGAMALANKAFKSGPLRSVAHAAIGAAMAAWMQSAMAANGVPPAQATSSPAANVATVSPPASAFMNQQAGNNVVNQIIQNAITQNAAKAQAAANAPPSPAQVSAHSISSAAAGKAGVPGVRPLSGENATGIPGRVQVVNPRESQESQSAGKEGATGKLQVTEPSGGSGSFNADHPRHPAGATGSKGGEFAPKGGQESGSESPASAPEDSSSPAVGDSPDETPSPRNYPDNLNKPASEQTNYSPPERSIEPPVRQSRKAAWEQQLKGVAEMAAAKKEAEKAEKKQAKELAKVTSFNPSELQSDMADDIEPASEAPKEDDFDSAKDYEKAVEKHNRSTGAKQATIKKRVNANLIPEIAGQYDLDHSTLQNAVDDEIQMLLPYHNRKEEARQYISKMGWNARRINQAEDRGIDSSSTQFDHVASQWADMFPEIAGSDESEWVARMWDLSKEGAQDPPSASDEDLVNRVAKRLSESGASSSPAEEEGFEYADAGPVSGEVGDVDYTPFHRKSVVDLIVDKYMRLAGIA